MAFGGGGRGGGTGEGSESADDLEYREAGPDTPKPAYDDSSIFDKAAIGVFRQGGDSQAQTRVSPEADTQPSALSTQYSALNTQPSILTCRHGIEPGIGCARGGLCGAHEARPHAQPPVQVHILRT